MTLRVSVSVVVVAIAASPAWAHPPTGIVADSKGHVYCLYGGRILRIDADGKMTFVENSFGGHHLAIDPNDNLYTVTDGDGEVWKVGLNGKMAKVGIQVGRYGDPFAVESAGTIYYVNPRRREQILKIDSNGRVGILAGGGRGFADGKGQEARFQNLHYGAFARGPEDALYVTDAGRSVRKIMPDGTVTTLAGDLEKGYADGPVEKARFNGAWGVAVDSRGNVYVAEIHNRRVRKISPDGQVTTLAGTGEKGDADGPALQASFITPTGIAVTPDGTVYVYDANEGDSNVASRGPTIRKISPDGIVTRVFPEKRLFDNRAEPK